MFYEERVMDNRLWYRNTPDGEWREVSAYQILGRMLLAEKQIERLQERLLRADGRGVDLTDPQRHTR